MAAWRAYVTASGRLLAALDAHLMEAHQLANIDYGVLVNLSESADGCLRMSALATSAGVDPSVMTYRIGRMEKKGLVERRTCPEDGRGVLAALTDEGRRVLDELAPTHVATVREMFVDRLSPSELDSIATIFERFSADAPTRND